MYQLTIPWELTVHYACVIPCCCSCCYLWLFLENDSEALKIKSNFHVFFVSNILPTNIDPTSYVHIFLPLTIIIIIKEYRFYWLRWKFNYWCEKAKVINPWSRIFCIQNWNKTERNFLRKFCIVGKIFLFVSFSQK